MIFTTDTLKIGDKIECLNQSGYYVMYLCGIVADIIDSTTFIVKAWDGCFYSSNGFIHRVSEIDIIK